MDRLANPVVFGCSTLDIEPHAGQIPYLLDDHPVKVLVGGRRAGKTHALALETVFHVARAVRDRKQLRQLVVAPALDQARLLFKLVANLLRSSPLGGLVEGESASPFPELRFPYDGAVFVRAAADGGKRLRGHAADRVLVDEAAFLADAVISESITPTLADCGGQLILASTPGPKGTLFHSLFNRGATGQDDRVRSFVIPSLVNPHLDAGYVVAQRETMTAAQWAAEYEGSFIDTSGSVFAWANVVACATGEEANPVEGHTYVLGWDPAAKRDRSGLVVLDTTAKPWRVVRVEDVRASDYVQQVSTVVGTARQYNNGKVVVDATGHGQVLVDLLRRDAAWVEPFVFTAQSKAVLVTALAVQFEQCGLIITPNRDLLSELQRFEARTSPTGAVTYGGSGAGFDDLVIALALAARGAGAGAVQSFASERLPPFLTSSHGWHDLPNVVAPGGLPDYWQDL